MSYNRRASNDLAESDRLLQLRELQSQLSVMIQHSRNERNTTDAADDDEEEPFIGLGNESVHSATSLPARLQSGSVDRGSLISKWERLRRESSDNSDHSDNEDGSLDELDLQVDDDDDDVESGLAELSSSFKPRRLASDISSTSGGGDDTLPVEHRATSSSSVASRASAQALLPGTSTNFHECSEVSESAVGSDEANVYSSDTTAADRSTEPTVGTTGSGSALDTSARSRKSRWSRVSRASDGGGTSRAGSRSPARAFSIGRKSRRSSSRTRGSFFKKEVTMGEQQKQQQQQRRNMMKVAKAMSQNQLPTYDFLEKEEKEGSSLRPNAKWWHGVFVFSLISMLACIITLWAPYPTGARMPTATVATMPWSNGCQGLESCICPRETICADDLLSMIFLTIARCSAWFDYPLYMLLFMSKANNLNNFLQKTALRCWINFSDYHRVHSLFGIIVGLESTSHSFFHILRWARRRDDIELLWTSRTGITGFIAIIFVPFIVLPMTVPYLKERMKFEWRKTLHYLSIVWGAALMCHAPQRIFWLIGVPLFIYTADKMVEGLLKTHLVESAHFQRLGDSSCLISFENPPGFGKQNSAYVYLMLPWLSKGQFHAFTVFPDTKPNHSSICIHKCGDWTGKLMKTITTPTHKPAFVAGPFLSPFSSPAMDSENLVAVASGIGVTPAISLIKQYSSTSRRLNLIWICRDAGLVEHFLQNVEFGSDGYTLIYYTGRDRDVILRDDLPPNIFMFKGRPNLERTISGIIASIATGEGLPEELHRKVLTRTPAEMRAKLLLEKALSIYTMDQLYDYTVKASNYYSDGLEHLTDTVNYQGVLSTMRHLLGDDMEEVTEKITYTFEKVDACGDCRLDRAEFDFFFNLMLTGTNSREEADVRRGLQLMSTTRDLFETSSNLNNLVTAAGAESITKLELASSGNSVAGQLKDEFNIKKHLQGDGKFSVKNWNMLYCGGSQPVLDQLKSFKRKFGVGLSVEKFDW